ncbi:MAG: hypothetical protein PHG00_09495 [Methylococcales bacterium]|nr:hypothetical protein [Methylococcales bacterium]
MWLLKLHHNSTTTPPLQDTDGAAYSHLVELWLLKLHHNSTTTPPLQDTDGAAYSHLVELCSFIYNLFS